MAIEAKGSLQRLQGLWNGMRPVGNRGGGFRIARNASWLTASRVLSDALTFLVFIAIARYYGPEGTGSYSFGFAIAGFVASIANPALSEYGIREYARAGAASRAALFQTFLGIQALLLLLAFLALAAALMAMRPSAEAAGLIIFLSIYMSALALARTLFIPAYADEAMALPSILELLCRLSAAATALVLMASASVPLVIALAGFPVFGLATAWAAAGSARRRARTFRANVAPKDLLAIAKRTWPFAGMEVIGQLHLRSEIILLGLLIGDMATGIYATGLRFFEVGISPLILLGLAAFPSLSRMSVGDRRAFERAAATFLRVSLALGGSLALALCFVVPPLLVPVLGVRFAEAAAILPWMSSLAILQAIELVMTRLLLVSDLQVRCFLAFALSTCVRLVVASVLIPHFQVAGAVAAGVVGYATLGLFGALALRGRLFLGEQVRIIGGFVAVLAAAVGSGLVAGLTSPWLAPFAAFLTFGLAVFFFGLLPRWPMAARPVPAQTLD